MTREPTGLKIIAEVAQGFEGSDKLVDLYVRAAARAGADAVKFQIFLADELALPDYQHYGLFKRLELPFEAWSQAIDQAHKLGIEFYSDVFGLTSLAELEKIGVDGYKVHATDINNQPLLKAVAQTKKPLLLSVGGMEPREIELALDMLKGADVVLMCGFQAEPTPIDQNNLRRLGTLSEMFGLTIGFQDHTAGDSGAAFYVPCTAMGAGAEVLEKHLTLSRLLELEDCVSALTPEEFLGWSALMRECHKALGSGKWQLSEDEREYRRKIKRAVCAARDINAGALIAGEYLTLKRTGSQALVDIDLVAGRRAKRDIAANAPINQDDLQ